MKQHGPLFLRLKQRDNIASPPLESFSLFFHRTHGTGEDWKEPSLSSGINSPRWATLVNGVGLPIMPNEDDQLEASSKGLTEGFPALMNAAGNLQHVLEMITLKSC